MSAAFLSDRSLRIKHAVKYGFDEHRREMGREAERILAVAEPETECVLDSWRADATAEWLRNPDGMAHPYAALAETLGNLVAEPDAWLAEYLDSLQ